MRRKIVFLLAAVLSFSLAACGADNSASSPRTDAPADSRTEAPVAEENGTPVSGESQSTGSNVLIAYFSVPEDVDAADAIAGASIVVRDGEKLGNTEYIAELIQETVGGDLFRIETVEEYDFGAKIIIPFITHGGSGASRTVDTISELQPGALMMGNELVLSRNDVAESEETVVEWAQGLAINAVTELPEAGDGNTVLTAAADGMIYSFYGRLSVGSTDVEMLRSGNLPPTFYCYGTRDPFYEQFLANADAVEAAGVRVERLQLDGRPHGFGYREDWFDAYDSFLGDVFSGQ